MPIVEVEQGGPEWLTMRCGMATGSKVVDIVTRLKKGGYSAARQNYLMEVVCSRLTGLSPDNFVTPVMQWGLDNEKYAVAAYEMQNHVMAEPGGFAMHPRIQWFGTSPDRLVGTYGLLEVKCPNSNTHLNWIMAGVLPEEHCPQMLAEMACTGRQWVDFVSFDPRMPQPLQLFIRRFHRDEELIKAMEAEVSAFLLEVEVLLEKIGQSSPVLTSLSSSPI